MSYKQVILNSDPLGYWQMTDYSEGGFYDITKNQNNTSNSVGFSEPTSFFNPPFTSSELNQQSYPFLSVTQVAISNQYNFFKKEYSQQTAGIEFWLYMPQHFGSSITKEIMRSGEQVSSNYLTSSSIYAIEDTLFFQVYGQIYNTSTNTWNPVSYTTKKQIYSWDEKLHIFALYKEKSISLYVNGISDEQVFVDKNFDFYDISNHNFYIGPTSSEHSFFINDLAFYERSLSLNEIRSHMFWANKDGDPDTFVKQSSAYHFNIKTNNTMIAFQKIFSKKTDYDLGFYSNLVADKQGITISKTFDSQPASGSWLYNFPISRYDGFAGIDISWDSAYENFDTDRYVSISASFDGGLTFYNVQNNKPFTRFLSNASSVSSSNLLLAVNIRTDNATNFQPRIDNLKITVYSSIDVPSDSGGFVIKPGSNATYNIAKNNTSFLQKSRNFGLVFLPSEMNSYATISSQNLTPYRTLEFIFGLGDTYLLEEGTGILHSNAIPGGYDLFFTPPSAGVSKKLNSDISSLSGAKIYINGVDQTSNFPLEIGPEDRLNIYHVLVVYPSDITSSIIINGSFDGVKTPCDASYGYINLFPYQLSSIEAQNRYLSYLSTPSFQVKNENNILGSVVEYSGTYSMVNAGFPVAFNDYVY